LGSEVNPSEVSEGLEAPAVAESRQELSVLAEDSPAPAALNLNPSPLSPSPDPIWLRLAYSLEFLIALIAIISLWSEVGGEGHLDLMPWYTKLGCILGLAWCFVRFSASLVEQQRVWTGRTIRWFVGILLFCLLMGGITYYYHLHEEQDDGDDDTTAAAVNIDRLGTFYHASKRTRPSFRICLVARSAVSSVNRVSVGSDGGDPRLRV
jgi:hypothetical protein